MGWRTVLAATGLVAALAFAATAGAGGGFGERQARRTTSQPADAGGEVKIPADLAGKLKEHGIDVEQASTSTGGRTAAGRTGRGQVAR